MNTDQITVHRQGRDLGPFTLVEINRQLQAGELAATDLAWPRGAPNWMPLSAVPGILLVAPPPLPARPPMLPAPSTEPGDATGGLIPYKNPKALIAYYLGIFSLIPCVGFFLAIAAVILGVLGLKARKVHPQVHGVAHAWIGIIVGAIVLVAHVIALAVLTSQR
jgi:hypothetical protein